MTASTPARILSLLLLALSIAPWASIYSLMVTLNSNNGSTSFLSNDNNNNNPLAAVLQDPNATLEEWWKALVLEHRHYKATSFLLPDIYNVHHFSIILPWSISLTLGIILPFFLSILSCLRYHEEEEEEHDDDDNNTNHASFRILLLSRRAYRRKQQQRLKQLQAFSKDYRKTLTEKDATGEDATTTTTNDEVSVFRCKLPNGINVVGDVDSCAICLNVYQTGDTVIWSSNPNCRHLFHDDCIFTWLSRQENKCPCCRQRFFLVQTKGKT